MSVEAEEMMKTKAVKQAAFTRAANSLSKLLQVNTPVLVLKTNLEELERRFNRFEESCENVMMLAEEVDVNLDALIEEKLDLLNDMRAQVDLRVADEQTKSVKSDLALQGQLVKSFQASLTLPKPELKHFNGDPSNFAEFISHIRTYIETNVTDDRQRLSLLIDNCTGLAHDAIAYLIQDSDASAAYETAKKTLSELFGQTHQVITAVLHDCTNGPSIRPNDIEQLKRLLINMKKAKTTLSSSGSADISSDHLVKIYRRIPRPIQTKWNENLTLLQDKNEKPNLDHMIALVGKFIKSQDNEYALSMTNSNMSVVHTSSGTHQKTKPVYAMSENKVFKQCLLCNAGHFLNQCPEFLQLSLKSKYDFVSQKRLCRNCLHVGHIANKCKRNGLCRQCTSKHNETLHDPNFKNAFQNETATAVKTVSKSEFNTGTGSVTNLSVTNNNDKNSIAGIACVEICVEGNDAVYKCKGIIDQKSSVNLCSQRLADKLKLPSTPFKTVFNVATGHYTVEGSKISGTKIYSSDMQNCVNVNDLLTVKSIPLSMNSIFTQNDISGLDHLHDVKIPKCSDNEEIDILIGSGVPKAFYQYEQRRGANDQIYAVRLTLGWDLVGPKRTYESCNDPGVFLIGQSPLLSDSLSNDLKMVFDKDFSDCALFDSKLCPSEQDKSALLLVKNSIVHKNNSFSVGIPWRQNPVNLPSNRESALKRLNRLKQRFRKDPSLCNAYSAEMKKFIDSGFIELSQPDAESVISHYIPHHPVWHPKKGSLRIVWDCAVSLNDFIYDGPDLLNSLTDILIRFRRFRYAVTSDIRKMYLNVKVPPVDRNALKILWWPDGDHSLEPIEYRAAVHIYGAKSSGFVANYCIRSLADQAEDQLISNVLQSDMYVDDQASSVECEAQAVSLVHGLFSTLSEGGFHLTKFMSNSAVVMNSLPDKNASSSNDSTLIDTDYKHAVLGLHWKVKSDELSIPFSTPDASVVATRRLLLSTAAQVYDPLGVVSPATLSVKVMLQNKTDIDWDESNSEIEDCWKSFCILMQQLSDFSFQRCYKPNDKDFKNVIHVSLHGFSDASNMGYSAVVYIRQVSQTGRIAVSFIIGKSRVAPKFKGQIPAVTVPKLELHAAALLAKLMDKVKGCIGIHIDEIFYWCDSQAVLGCIKATDKRFNVYWSNRLAIILGLSLVEQWRYVPTKCNPADVGSRGIHPKNVSAKMQLWVNGPGFLMLCSDKWPEITQFEGVGNAVMLTDVHKVLDNDPCELLGRVVSYVSNLFKLVNVVVRLLCFMSCVQRKMKKRSQDFVGSDVDQSTDSDSECALIALIRFEQRLLLIPHLKALKPFKDEKGILRVHSRLADMKHLLYDQRFPIILPKRSNLTRLIIRDVHEKSAHMGPNHVLSQLRLKYWVIGGKSTIKSMASSCRKCKEKNARPLKQLMSSLPEERGMPSFPFQNVGLDYFGPFFCKLRRQRFKRYGCIFVCLATRAVHIECVNSLESNAFLCALTRFIARRGKPEKIFSDNATNFKGAQDELKHTVRAIDSVASGFASQRGFKWHFHPPHGSHHGGHYERLIRSVREVLHGITNEQEMSEDNLTTFLCEAERILNDRPLTQISDDPNDLVPLTPSLILLLRGNSCDSLFESENIPKSYHRQAQFLADIFWKRWLKEYIPSLQPRQKWLSPQRNLKVGDLVFMCGEGYSRGQWPIARVVEVFTGPDKLVRKVTVRDKNGLKVRPISKLALLEAVN